MTYNYSFKTIWLLSICILFSFKSKGEKDIEITSFVREVSYKIGENNQLEAILEVSISYISNSNIKQFVPKSIFFDNYSNIDKIRINKKRKIKPIISDYESEGIFHSDMKVAYVEIPIDEKNKIVTLSYKKSYSDVKFLNSLYFVDQFNIQESKIIINKPEWLILNVDFVEYRKTRIRNR